MAIIYVKNKRNGVTYVYESTSFWDKEKKQGRNFRVCIGKLHPETQEIIYNKDHKHLEQSLVSKDVQLDSQQINEQLRYKRSFCGATYLFDQISEQLGVTSDLKCCFPKTYKQILSTAYYLILEDKSPMSRFNKWSSSHEHPYGNVIPPQRSSQLFSSIKEDAKQRFFIAQTSRRLEEEYLAYDTNVISSYSQTLNLSNYGVNNEYDPIAQINLVLLLGKTSRLPVCYHKLPGKISDVTTIKNLLIDLKYLNINSIKLVLDNEFYSQANINLLYSCDYKFLFAGKLSLKYIQKELSLLRDTMMQNRNYSSKHSLYCQSVSIPWSFQKSNKEIATHPLYLHFYYNDQRASDEKNSLNTLLEKLEEELMCDKIDPKNEKLYLQYFTITQIEDTTQDGKITIKKIISLNEDAITTKIKNFGYFVLMSNSISSAKEAIRIYRSKDLIKKGYGNFKNRLSIKGTLVSSEESLDGKIFVQFVALILVSFIKQQMDKYNLFKQYTFQEAIDELDTIERLTLPNNTIISEVTKKQQELYKLFGVDIIS